MPSPQQKKLLTTLTKFYQNPVTKVSLEIFLSLFLIIFFGVFVIRPTLVTIADLIKEIDDKQELDQQLQRKITSLATAQEEFNQSKEKIIYLDQAITSQPELVRSLKTVEKIASEHRVIISSLKTSAVPEEKKAQGFNTDQLTRIDLYFTFQVMGDYPSIKNFVEGLHQYRRAFIVEEINFNIQDRITLQTLRANVTVRVPYFGDKNAQQVRKTTRSN